MNYVVKALADRAQREVRAAVTALAAELPVKGRLQYRSKNMENIVNVSIGLRI